VEDDPHDLEMKRPKATVLPDSAVVPDQSLVRPAPTAFTHELTVEQPYHYAGSDRTSPPDGVLPAGTKVVLLDDALRDRVRDARDRDLMASAGCVDAESVKGADTVGGRADSMPARRSTAASGTSWSTQWACCCWWSPRRACRTATAPARCWTG
jgi:hypothetical protein